MVLLFTLMMIVVCSLLILTQLQAVFIHYQTMHALLHERQAFFNAEKVARKLAFLKNIPPKCLYLNQDPNELLQAVNKGCLYVEDGALYHYVVEDLGDYPCLRVHTGSQDSGTHHRLLTLQAGHDILQLRVGVAAQIGVCEHVSIQWIREGLLSWRFLR